MADRSPPRRRPSRYLAPLALLVIIAVIYFVADHALNPTSAPTSPRRSLPVNGGSVTRHIAKSGHKPAKPRDYVVRAGDNLSVISARTGVPLPTLLSLNPKVTPTSLQVGQRLKLR